MYTVSNRATQGEQDLYARAHPSVDDALRVPAQAVTRVVQLVRDGRRRTVEVRMVTEVGGHERLGTHMVADLVGGRRIDHGGRPNPIWGMLAAGRSGCRGSK